MLPIVSFKKNKALDVLMLAVFTDPKEPWRERIFKLYPELETLKNETNRNKRLKVTKNFVEDFYDKNKQEIETTISNIQKAWDKIGRKLLQTLSEVFQTDWGQIKRIIGFVSINPLGPRFLHNNTFQVAYFLSQKRALELVLHEITHFIYFKKWAEVFPQDKTKTFDYPYLNWTLSEILTPVVACDLRIENIIHPTVISKGYEEHEAIRVKFGERPISLVDYFKLLYKKFRREDKSFEDFLKEARKE
ncbi:hypothetical protein A2Z23_01610, partial [Candidatus Curtissbacteria bacterium RBG_16_39_7]